MSFEQSDYTPAERNVFKVFYPRGCEIKATEFSTSGGESPIEYLELDLLCNGVFEKFFAVRTAFSGLFGLSRWFLPDAIVFEEWDQSFAEFENHGFEGLAGMVRNRETWIAKLPSGCNPVNSEFSSSSYLQYLEIDCRFSDKPYTKFFAKRLSSYGALDPQLARLRAIPLKMEFEYGNYDGAYLTVKGEQQTKKSGEVWHARVPENCNQIEGTSFSTGNTSLIQYVEIDCSTKQGERIKYIAARYSRKLLMSKVFQAFVTSQTKGDVDLSKVDRDFNFGVMILPTKMLFIKTSNGEASFNPGNPRNSEEFYK